MLILFIKSQLGLFDMPVLIAGSVKKDGTVTKPHIGMRKKRIEAHVPVQADMFGSPEATPEKKRRASLEALLRKYGGAAQVAAMMRGVPEEKKAEAIAKMAKFARVTPEEMQAALDSAKPEDAPQMDLFGEPVATEGDGYAKPEPVAATVSDERPDSGVIAATPATDAAIIEYTTKKGKVLTGIVRTDLTQGQAKEIDPYTFKLNGGWFIREKHLGGAADQNPIKNDAPAAATVLDPSPAAAAAANQEIGSDLSRSTDPLVFGVAAGISKADRRKLNAAAAALVTDKTSFDERDREILRQYSGNGGCGDSLNEFYTDPAIAKAIWDVADRLGYQSGTCLEPSCATGVFLHTAPAGFKITGVEMDPTSASIATALHGDRHEIVNASLERFATQDLRQFNVVVGNPPFGVRGMLAKDDKIDLSKAEEYFIDTGLDKTLPGGLCVMIVPAGIMDSKNGRRFRERVLRKAEFLGAQRMPNTAFEASHTDVTADVLFFRKRGDDVAGALGTVDQKTLQALQVWDPEFLSGGYFEGRGAGNVFGTVGTAMRAFGEIYTVNGSMHGVADEVAKFEPHPVGANPSVPDILAALPDEAAKNRALNAAEKRPYQDTAKVGDIRMIDGVAYVLQGSPARWHRVDEALQSDAVTSGQDLAGQIDRIMAGGDVDREKLQADLKAWVATHGIPAKNPNLLVAAATDKTLYRLIGAVGKDGSLSDVVTGTARRVEGGFDSVAQSLALSHDTSDFSAGELAEALGKPLDEVEDQLAADTRYAISGDGRWAPMDVYLTGELWPKLDEVRATLAGDVPADVRDKLDLQARRLEETIDPKSLEDVDIAINSAFMPTSVIEAWLNSRVADYKADNATSSYAQGLKEEAKVTFDKGVYSVAGGKWSDAGLLDKYLNRTGVRKDDLPALERMNEEFKDWLCASPLRDEVEDLYNRKFRGFVQRDFSNEPIDVPGLANHDKIKDYQWPGLRWALAAGKGIIAADVGLGKAQPLDAKVLTPAGWKLMGDISVGDSVISVDGKPTTVTGVFPQGEKEIFRVVFHDGSSTECCDEHLWLTQTHKDRNNARRNCHDLGVPKVRTLAEIRETMTYRGMKNHAVPMVMPVEFAEQAVPLNPYLLGALLGDGSLSQRTPYFTSADKDIVVACGLGLPDGHMLSEATSKSNAGEYRLRRSDTRFGRNEIYFELKEMGLNCDSFGKFVPDVYKFNSVDVRLAVLRGLMDTDGYVDKAGVTVQFSSCAERLAKDVQFLAQSLGGTATIKTKIPTYRHKGEKRTGAISYTVHLRMPASINPFYCERKAVLVRPKSKYIPVRYIVAIEPVGTKPAQCISVDHESHLYVTDDFIVTHNTLRGLLLARMAKVEGRAQKPTIVVPKSVLANWYAEADKWFPGSKVLTIGATFQLKDGVLTGKDDDANERKRKYHDLSQNDYDFVIISEPAFEELDLDPVTKNDYYSQDFWVQRGDSLGNAGDKRVKKIRENYEQAIAKREFSDRTDAIYFNDIGIDMLIADEMHHQKNLYAAKNRFGESPKFLGGQGLSNRALDFNLKTRWLLKEHGNKGVYGLTATPTKNSPLEVYSMLCHIAPEAFENIGIRNSEEFLDRFCVFQNDTVLNTRGEIEDALITAGFKNMNELREIMKRYIDRTTAEQVGLVLPKRDDHMHFVEMTPAQEEVYATYREMLENDAKEKDATGDSHIFSIMDKMNKAALDLEILDPVVHKGAASPKYKSLAKHVAEGVRDGGQVIFSDYIDSHDKIVDALVASGIKREQIGIINAQVAGSAVKRQNIADKFNSGKFKVVIGNTATMGEGINLQMGTADIHHLDLPWEPASMQQRNGRGLRQGNIKESIRIHTYLSKGSFDGYRYQSIAAKKDWQDLLWSGGDRVDNLARDGKFSRQDIQIMMSSDPEAAREKFENDKSLAMAQHESGERVKAAEVFVRFQELKAGYKSLKNKGTASAARLKQKLEDTKTALKSNRFFTAKTALDSDEAVVIQPQTGMPFHAGVAFSATTDGADEGKFVVTGVNLRAGTVSVRPYASTTGGKKTVALDKLAHGVTTFAFDGEAEGREVAAAIEKAASEKVNSIENFDDVMKMPSGVLEAAHDSIQQQLKAGAKSYKVRFPGGKVPMINRDTGELKMVESYSHSKLGETHDYLLPTEANKQKVEQAWKDAERGAKFATGTLTTGRKNSQKYLTTAEKHYPGTDYNDKATNPWSKLYTEMNGGSNAGYYGESDTPQVRELRQRHEAEQLIRVRRAPTFKDALYEAMPLGTVSDKNAGYSAAVKLPKRALAMLWAKARHDGVLGDQIDAHEPKDEGSKYGKHAGFAMQSRKSYDVHTALMAMARAGGYHDLSAAMAESGARHHKGENAAETLKMLTSGFGHGTPTLRSALSAAERAGVAEKKIRDFNHHDGLLHNRMYGGTEDKTVRQVIEERIAYNEQQDNKKEAA